MKAPILISLTILLAVLAGWFFGYESGADRPATVVAVPDQEFCQEQDTQELCFLRCANYIIRFTLSDLGSNIGRTQWEKIEDHCAVECNAIWQED